MGTIWKPKRSVRESHNDDFRVYDGKIVKGKMDWKSGTSKGTQKKREASINLNAAYSFHWNDYIDIKQLNDIGSVGNSLFRYIVIEVRSDQF